MRISAFMGHIGAPPLKKGGDRDREGGRRNSPDSTCSSVWHLRSRFKKGTWPPPLSLCRAPLKLLCDNMKYQIVSRAFYGCEYFPR